MINVVIPMAGAGKRFSDAGYKIAKPFININGKMMVEYLLECFDEKKYHVNIIIQKEFNKKYDKEINFLYNNYNLRIHYVETITQGAVCTVLSIHKIINNHNSLLICDCDTSYKDNTINKFIEFSERNNVDASIITFKSSLPIYSYAKIKDNNVVMIKEKDVISEHALSGSYFFKKGEYFFESALQMIIYGDKIKNEFYISNVFNYMLQKNIKNFSVNKNDIYFFGTPDQIKEYY